jgi:hypothetical protein
VSIHAPIDVYKQNMENVCTLSELCLRIFSASIRKWASQNALVDQKKDELVEEILRSIIPGF